MYIEFIERLILEGSDISTLKMHTFSSMTYKRLLRAAIFAKSPQRTLHAIISSCDIESLVFGIYESYTLKEDVHFQEDCLFLIVCNLARRLNITGSEILSILLNNGLTFSSGMQKKVLSVEFACG